MKLLTSKAIQGYRDYTKRTIAYAKYKIGSTYHKAKIESVEVTGDGLVEIMFKIETGSTGAATVTEIQLYDTNNDLWLSKQESLKMDSVPLTPKVMKLESVMLVWPLKNLESAPLQMECSPRRMFCSCSAV